MSLWTVVGEMVKGAAGEETKSGWGKAGKFVGKYGKDSSSSGAGTMKLDKLENQISSQIEEITKLSEDKGFYGHSAVPNMKSDKSGFYKHMNEVAKTLF